ncbi:hypothetical protein FHG87_019734 [Trinorchestia longiramus]|nr:hypothetical protein FHG87_019734 [Trinorchestia longiramus]
MLEPWQEPFKEESSVITPPPGPLSLYPHHKVSSIRPKPGIQPKPCIRPKTSIRPKPSIQPKPSIRPDTKPKFFVCDQSLEIDPTKESQDPLYLPHCTNRPLSQSPFSTALSGPPSPGAHSSPTLPSLPTVPTLPTRSTSTFVLSSLAERSVDETESLV